MIRRHWTKQRHWPLARITGRILVVSCLFILASTPVTAETFRFYTPPRAAAPAEYPGVFCEAALVLTGLSDRTRYRVYDLGNLTAAPLSSGEVDRFETLTIPASVLGPDGVFQLETSDMVLAHLGDDCLGQDAGGSFFFHTEDGRSFIGRDFLISIPVLGPNNEFLVFAYQNAEVTFEAPGGELVERKVITANSYWKPSKLSAAQAYRVRSTGNVALQSNALDGYTSVPGSHSGNLTSCYNHAATNFLFATSDGDSNNVLLLTAYEDASLILFDLDAPQDAGTNINLKKGDIRRLDAPATQPGHWRLESTNGGRVTIQVGLEEEDSVSGYVADDIDFHAGFDAYDFFFHSMTQGATAFMNADHTAVSTVDLVSGAHAYTLNATDTLELAPLTDWEVHADLPIAMETVGGTMGEEAIELNDYGTFVLPAFSVDRNVNDVPDHLEDLDHDGNPNACDLDDDGDGISDKLDRCPHTSGTDSDNDGCPDAAGDEDSDGDGVPNDEDACPDSPEDLDNDFDDDGCPETTQDSDGDGVDNDIDNCPEAYNPGQADTDGDGIGDACEDGRPGIGATGGGAVFGCQAAPAASSAARRGSSSLFIQLLLVLTMGGR